MNPDYFNSPSVRIGRTPLDEKFPKNNGMPLIDIETPTTIWHVQSRINRYVRYKPDPKDIWQEPAETVGLRTGDCEDYCFLKRALLIDKGFFEPRDLFFVVGVERNVGFKRPEDERMHHAVLVARFNKKWLVFDNVAPRVVTDDVFGDVFTPIFSYVSDNVNWDNPRKFVHGIPTG